MWHASEELYWHQKKVFPPRCSPPQRHEERTPPPQTPVPASTPPSPAMDSPQHGPRLAPGLIFLFHPIFHVAFTQHCSRVFGKNQAGDSEGWSKHFSARCEAARSPRAASPPGPRRLQAWGILCPAPSSTHLLTPWPRCSSSWLLLPQAWPQRSLSPPGCLLCRASIFQRSLTAHEG